MTMDSEIREEAVVCILKWPFTWLNLAKCVN